MSLLFTVMFQKNAPNKPIIFLTILQDFIDQNEEYTSNQKNNEVGEKTFLLFNAALGIFQKLVLLDVQAVPFFLPKTEHKLSLKQR